MDFFLIAISRIPIRKYTFQHLFLFVDRNGRTRKEAFLKVYSSYTCEYLPRNLSSRGQPHGKFQCR